MSDPQIIQITVEPEAPQIVIVTVEDSVEPEIVVIDVGERGPVGGGSEIETVAESLVSYVFFDGTWSDRPTARTDLMVLWVGPDPSPDIVSPPSVAGMYSGDARIVIE